jgi:hypothetical protein
METGSRQENAPGLDPALRQPNGICPDVIKITEKARQLHFDGR